MISPTFFWDLDAEEQKLWHSHVFEVKSGVLCMPKPVGIPETVWLTAETKSHGGGYSFVREHLSLLGSGQRAQSAIGYSFVRDSL
jgi:hypothetical protein